MEMGDDANAMLDVIKDQNCLGKAKDCERQINLIWLGKWQMFKACDRLISQIADSPTMKGRQLILQGPIWPHQPIAAQLLFDQLQRILAWHLFHANLLPLTII